MMKWLNSILVIGLSILLIGCSGKYLKMRDNTCVGGVCKVSKGSAASVVQNQGYIDAVVLKNLIDSKVAVTVLDARSGKYDDGRRIIGAKALSSEATAEQAAQMIKDKNSLIVTYCTNVKCPASAKLAKHLKSLGYTNILEYPGGIEGWAEAGYEIEKA